MKERYTKGQFLKNIGSGWLAVFITGLVGFFTLPMNLKYLGKDLYGVSALATSALTMFSFLQLGMGPTLVRFFSQAIVKKDQAEIKKLSSVTQLLLGGLGLAGGIGFIGLYPYFISIYEVPESAHQGLYALFLAQGLAFFVGFLLIPFSTIISGSNRMDAVNLRSSISSLLKIITLYIGYQVLAPSLWVLAISVFVGTVYLFFSTLFLAYRLQGNAIFFSPKFVHFALFPSLFSFSFLVLINGLFFNYSTQMPILIIGKTLDPSMVAAFAPSLILATFCGSILEQISSPLVPMASKNLAEQGGDQLGRWSMLIGEIVAIVGCSIILVFALFGHEILTLWMGEEFAWTSPILTVMVFGIVVSTIQTSNYRLAVGASTIAPIAYSAVVMAVLTTLGTWLGTAYWGWSLLGVALCITSIRVLRNTFFIAYIYSRIFRYNYWGYTWCVYIKPMFLALVVGICFYFLKQRLAQSFYLDFTSIPTLITASVFVAGLYFVSIWYLILSRDIKNVILSVLKKKFEKKGEIR